MEPISHEGRPARWRTGKTFDPLSDQGDTLNFTFTAEKPPKRARHKVRLAFPKKIQNKSIKLFFRTHGGI